MSRAYSPEQRHQAPTADVDTSPQPQGEAGATASFVRQSLGEIGVQPGARAASAPSFRDQALGEIGSVVQQRARGADGAPAGESVHDAAARGTRGPGGPLPHLDTIQRAFGRHDVRGVQAHAGEEATEAAQAMGADAFATGTHVAFAGTPNLHTAAHEAAHVVQQRGGVQLKGGVGAEGDSYESHADAVADQVVRGESAEALLDGAAGTGASPRHEARTVQRKLSTRTPRWTWDASSDFEAFKKATGLFATTEQWEKVRALMTDGRERTFGIKQELAMYLRSYLETGIDDWHGDARAPVQEKGSHKLGTYSVGNLLGQHAMKQAEDAEPQVSGPVANLGISGQMQGASKQAALDLHHKDREALKRIVEEGAARDVKTKKAKADYGGDESAARRLANSCEWVKAGRVKLYAITQTGDSAERVRHHGKDASHRALFPRGGRGTGGDIYDPRAADYDETDLQNLSTITLQPNGGIADGWNEEKVIAVLRASTTTKERVWQVICHEAQHEADQHFDKWEGTDDWSYRLESYKTEYRAYSYERGSTGANFDQHSRKPNEAAYGYMWTAKQKAIFDYIFRDYEHTRRGWGAVDGRPAAKDARLPDEQDESFAQRQRFQQAVVDYQDPDSEGFNKYNSLPVDAFYAALKKVPIGTQDANATEVKALRERLDGLSKEDAVYIQEESPDFSKMVTARLQKTALEEIQLAIAQKAGR